MIRRHKTEAGPEPTHEEHQRRGETEWKNVFVAYLSCAMYEMENRDEGCHVGNIVAQSAPT